MFAILLRLCLYVCQCVTGKHDSEYVPKWMNFCLYKGEEEMGAFNREGALKWLYIIGIHDIFECFMIVFNYQSY